MIVTYIHLRDYSLVVYGAFAILAIKKNMDLFGVNVVALLTANVIFVVLYMYQNRETSETFAVLYDDVMLWSDAAGLAVLPSQVLIQVFRKALKTKDFCWWY